MQVTAEHLRDLVPMSTLDEGGREEVLKHAKVLSLERNHQLYPIESDDGFVYYLLEGAVAMADRQGREAQLSADTKQARYAFGTLKPRPANARIVSNSATVLCFQYQELEQVILDVKAANNGVSKLLTDTSQGGFSVEEWATDSSMDHGDTWFLAQLAIRVFPRFSTEFLKDLLQRMEPVRLKAGEALIDTEDEADAFYIIRDGFCRICHFGYLLGMQEPMDSIGEYELITGKPHQNRVEMLTDGILMRLPKKAFDELLKPRFVQPLSYKETRKKLKEGAILLDLRDEQHYKEQRLVRSINIPMPTLKSQLPRLDTNKAYVLYADTAEESAAGAFIMSQKGYTSYYLTEPQLAFDRIAAK